MVHDLCRLCPCLALPIFPSCGAASSSVPHAAPAACACRAPHALLIPNTYRAPLARPPAPPGTCTQVLACRVTECGTLACAPRCCAVKQRHVPRQPSPAPRAAGSIQHQQQQQQPGLASPASAGSSMPCGPGGAPACGLLLGLERQAPAADFPRQAGPGGRATVPGPVSHHGKKTCLTSKFQQQRQQQLWRLLPCRTTSAVRTRTRRKALCVVPRRWAHAFMRMRMAAAPEPTPNHHHG